MAKWASDKKETEMMRVWKQMYKAKNVQIYSRDAIEKLLHEEKTNLDKVAVISFYDPPSRRGVDKDYKPVDYFGKANRLFQIPLHDIDIEILADFDLTYETYLPEVDKLAEFIYAAKSDKLDIICQCEYGQSRSAGCAAAIREHFNSDGIKVFADYRYYPNQLVYNKVYDALEEHIKRRTERKADNC